MRNYRKRNNRRNNPRIQYSLRNVAMITPAPVVVTNSTYAFSSGALAFSVSSLIKANLAWLGNYIDLFDEFRFTQVQVQWIPAASSFTTGALGFYYDPDPNAGPPTTFDSLSGNRGLVLTQVSQRASLRVPPQLLNRLPWFTAHGTTSTDTQGVFCYAFSPGNVASGSGNVTLGHFMLRYTVTCRNPTAPVVGTRQADEALPQLGQEMLAAIQQMQPEAVGRVAETMDPAAATPLWTNSSGGKAINIVSRYAATMSEANAINEDDPKFVSRV